MDADSSYGGSDTAQDYHSTNENNSSFETSHNDARHNHNQVIVTCAPVLTTQSPSEEMNNQFYHINEVTLPINYNENGYQSDESISPPREPHYLSTANLNINETLEHHSNLEEMNKQYKSTSHLNSESPRGMRRSNSGIDNMVFEDDVPDQANVKSTFDNTKPYNGELHPSLALGTNSHKHEEPMTEAVNLELINLKPVGKDVTGHYENVGNGMTTIPLKRENDTEVGNPYDEYFVPVNEHRKYMRGEKLYVTMDKRGKKSKSKCLCWGICLCIVAAALIIGILAAVGVIGSQEPLKEASARSLDGTEPEIKKGSLFSTGKVSNNEPSTPESPITTIYNMPPSTEMPIIQVSVTENRGSSEEVKGRQLDETEPKMYEDSLPISLNSSNTEPPTPFTPAPSISTVSNIPPSTEMSMIQVPRALDSNIIIDNIQFTPALAIANNSEFKALSAELGNELKGLLFSKDVLLYGPAEIKIRVKEFVPDRSGSVIVNYRLVWIFKHGIHNPKDPIDKITLEKKMSQFLEQSNRLIGPYHISEMPVTAEKILDLCKIDNNGCEHICLFDYDVSDFACICAAGNILAMDKKMCINKPEHGSNSNTDLINNFNDQEDHYSKYEPKFETITTQSSDSEFNKNLYYNNNSTSYSVISPQPESTIKPKSESAISASTEQYLVQDTEKYVSEMVSDIILAEKSNKTVANSYTETEPSNTEKINKYYSDSADIMQTQTEYSLERDNLSNIDTTTVVSNMAHEPANTFEITTNINDMKGNKNSEQLTSSSAEHSLANVESNSTLNETVETTTELLGEPTTERTGDTTLQTTSEYVENSSKNLNEEKQNRVTENMQITTNPTKKNIKSAYNENYTMPESTTYPYVLSEDKMNELGLLKVVTPEAEVYTTTDFARVPEFVDYNKIYKTLKKESNPMESLNIINNTNKRTSTKNMHSTIEITTEMLSQIRDNELHFIPVIVHEDTEANYTEIVPATSNFTTEIASTFENLVPGNVSEHYETNNERPKIYEVTTQQVNSDKKKNIETSTEKLPQQINVVVHPENAPNDFMSPFLPEIENDTFANTLHSDDHFNDNLFISKHVDLHENINEQKTSAPNLENDQMNHTNPLDLQQNDTYLGVLPLQRENGDEIPPNHIQKETNNPDNMAKVNIENIIYNENSNLNPGTESNLESTTTDVEHSTMLAATEMTLDPVETISTEREVTTDSIKTNYMSLPPEIINNVHSNNYFEDNPKILEEKATLLNDQITKEQEVTTEAETEISTVQISLDMNTEYPQLIIYSKKNMRNDTSTEDLIASETTTNTFKGIEDENQDITSESNYSTENPTINGETIETATEFVDFVTTHETDILTKEFTTSASQTSTSQSPSLDPINQYEVKESFADITTTEKLFLTVKPDTNIVAIVNQEDNEDLSIVPLEKKIADHTKFDKKRLANEDGFNQLELLDNNSFNSISNEDHNLDTFPQEFDSKYVGSSPQKENITNSDYANKSSKEIDYANNSSREIKNDKQKLEKYNKAIFNKTIKHDILVLKDDNDSLNTLNQEEKLKPNNFEILKPVTEDFSLPRFTRCLDNQFPCLNGTYIKDGSYCIPKNDRCDSVRDCSDGSDEINCLEEGCPNNFQCSSGQCLKRYLVCDGIINCNDGSDEINCDKWICNLDELSCGPGNRCIPIPWKCDGRSHCSDGSDEHHCHQYACSNDTFHCKEQDTCIPLSWKCDGKSDCANGDDEKICECTKEQFKCKIGGGCIDMEKVCDGIDQCADKSDEWNCLRLEELKNISEEASHRNILQVNYRNSTWYPVCMDWNNWNTTYADKICQNMGFVGATLLESVPKSKDFKADGYYKLVTPSETNYGLSILSQLEKTGNDNCDQLVSIKCQEFACGSTASTDQIDVNSNKTLPTQLTSLGLLYDIKRNNYCSATMLTPLWAIASYSCMVAASRSIDSSEWTLSAGSHNFNQLDNSTAQTRFIKQIIPHPQAKFSRFEFTNDIVLIQLSQPLILNRNISTVCLPSKDTETEQQCVTAGWKVSKPGEPFKQQYIHYISGPTINSEECNSTKHYNGMITKDKICAAYNKKDTPCYNDEGAPLLCFSNVTETWELQGIQSHQENCGENTQPTTYSAINVQLKNWISNTIGKEALVRKL